MFNKRSLFHNSLLSLTSKNKRGISAIVATVMIILITVAAIGILWAAIIPMIQTNLDFSSLQGRVSVLDKGYTAYDSNQKIASVQVKRDVDDGVMDRIKITFEVGGNSHSSSVIAPESGGTKVYTFDMTGIGEPDSVSVAPIFAVGNKEKEGEITSTVDIPKSRISEAVATYETGRDYTYGESCKDILDSKDAEGDGIYWIDVDGLSGDKEPFAVYCDMTTDNGGWTLVGRTGDTCDGQFGWNYQIGSLGELSECYSLGVGVKGMDFSEIMWGINSNNFEWGAYIYKAPMSDEDIVTYSISVRSPSTPIPIKGGNFGNSMQRYRGYTSKNNSFFMRDVAGVITAGYGMSGTSFVSVYCGAGDDRGGYMCGEKAMLFVR